MTLIRNRQDGRVQRLGIHSGHPLRFKDIEHCRDRFEDLFDRADGCWMWRGAMRRAGWHGCFRVNGRVEQAHRVAMVLSGTNLSARSLVIHSCDVPSCVNPAHLRIGTAQDNRDDAVARGRARGAPRNLNGAKLDRADVLQMRRMRANGAKLVPLAKMFGVCIATVSLACNGKTWT